MSEQTAALHPKFAQAIESGDSLALVSIALTARAKAQEGYYCTCTSPSVHGLDLMCGACLLNNRDQELRRLLSIYGAHEFQPDESPSGSLLGWCRCTWDESNARHHGEDMRFFTTWGDRYEPPHDALRASLIGSSGDPA